jgi:hypothetical protein
MAQGAHQSNFFQGDVFMRFVFRRLAISLASLTLSAALAAPAFADSTAQTFTGEVSDSMCGAKHMEGSPAECTKACVKQGSKYALVVGEKVYTLESSDKAVLSKLDELAGQKAKVKGVAKGDTIAVSSVAAGK